MESNPDLGFGWYSYGITAIFAIPVETMMTSPIRILGIDPGLRRTGWGLISCVGNNLKFVACGTVTSDAKCDLAERLLQIHNALDDVIAAYAPDEAAVEQTFVNHNGAATLKLGQARGVAMLVPAKSNIQVAEYAPNAVKKTVIGAGHGDKKQIRTMVSVLLPTADFKSDDAADALAIAITHAHHRTAYDALALRSQAS